MSGYNCNWQRMRAVLTHECINKCTEKESKKCKRSKRHRRFSETM